MPTEVCLWLLRPLPPRALSWMQALTLRAPPAGTNYPIMNHNERVLSVLGCRYVDDVLIDAPWDITREMIAALKISVVATGTTRDCSYGMDESKYYQVPRAMGLLRTVKSNATITVEDIVERILSQEAVYQLKLKKKTKAENEYYSDRFGFDVTKPEDQVSPSLTPPLLKI
jgi:glycerol-3-phosphate cytidylyltransferase-like family protein